jgi:hypothetical protein
MSFTNLMSGYTQLVERAGSILQLNEDLDVSTHMQLQTSSLELLNCGRPRRFLTSFLKLNHGEMVTPFVSWISYTSDILLPANS